MSVLPQTGQLALTQQYSEYTTRGKANLGGNGDENEAVQDGLTETTFWNTAWREEWWSIAIPDVKGGNNQLYWGEQRFSEGPFTSGRSPCLVLAWPSQVRLGCAGPCRRVAAGRGVVVARRHRLDRRVPHVPLFNKFRDTKMMLFS